MCNGADEGWARVIEARGGRPRKSRGRAIAETPPPHNGYLRDGKGVSAMYRRHRRSHLVVPASCATHQDFAASFDHFCRFSFVCREKAGNKSKL